MRELRFEAERNERLSVWLKRHFSHGRIVALKRGGRITASGRDVHADYRLCCGETISLLFCEPPSRPAIPGRMDIDIVFEDEDIAVVRKGRGILSTPSGGAPCLLEGLALLRPGVSFHVATRLDKDTVGLVLLCKSALSRSLMGYIDREYLAVVRGFVAHPFVVDTPISRGKGIKRITGEGKPALTSFEPLVPGNYTLLKCVPVTGRTHQIRAHLAAAGFPVAGDTLYGGAEGAFNSGQSLGCVRLRFTHPLSGAVAEFYSSSAAAELEKARRRLNGEDR